MESLCGLIGETLGERRRLGADGSYDATDCLVFAYLVLLLHNLTEGWIAQTVRERYPIVAGYLDGMRREFYSQGSFDVKSVMQRDIESWSWKRFPWQLAPPPTFGSACAGLLRSTTRHVLSPLHRLDVFGPRIFFTKAPEDFHFFSPMRVLFALSGPLMAGAVYALYVYTHSDWDRDKYFGPKQNIIAAALMQNSMMDTLDRNSRTRQGVVTLRSKLEQGEDSRLTGWEGRQTALDSPPMGIGEEEVGGVEVSIDTSESQST